MVQCVYVHLYYSYLRRTWDTRSAAAQGSGCVGASRRISNTPEITLNTIEITLNTIVISFKMHLCNKFNIEYHCY